MEAILRDLRLAARALAREPGFTATALLALTLGVGANTAVFSVVKAVLVRPLPFTAADRLVTVWDTHPARDLRHVNPSPGNFLDWQNEKDHFAGMSVFYSGRGTYRHREGAEVVQTVKASPGFFDVLGAKPIAGRVFQAGELGGAVYNVAEMNQGGDRALVLSEAFWRRALGADKNVIGTTISFDGAEWTVLGVVPDELAVLTPGVDVYIPWDIPASYAKFPAGTPRDFRFVNVVARLAPGVSMEAAGQRLNGLAKSLAEKHPRENAGWGVELVPLAEELRGPVRAPLLLLFGATSVVLFAACLNVASLQVARAAARERESAVRAALGASKGQLFRHAFAEGALLALAGALAGIVVARVGVNLLLAIQPWDLPAVGRVELDGGVLAFALCAAGISALLFGGAPLLRSGRKGLVSALSQGGRSSSPGRESHRLRRALVALQIAVSLVLLAGAGLFTRSFVKARARRPGFDASNLLVVRISLDKATYFTGQRSGTFYQSLTKRLESLPGVESAAGVTALPMSKVGPDFARPYWREGDPDPGGQAARAAIRMATPRYFETLRAPVLRGRAFTDADRFGAPVVIAINETLARRAFGAEDPLGRRLVIDYKGGAYPYEVVGLVADMRFDGLKSEPIPEIFIPHLQNQYLDLNVIVRTRDAPRRLERAARAAVAELDPAQPIHSVVTMEELVASSVATDRFFVTLLGSLATAGLVLAATGVYGLLAYLVRRRAHEFGLRQALGARPADVLRLVLDESLRLAAAGIFLGLSAALLLGGIAKGQLFEVTPADPLTLALVAALLGSAVLAASALPARAATRIDPAVAMRCE